MATQGIQPSKYRRLHPPGFCKINAEIIWNYRQYLAPCLRFIINIPGLDGRCNSHIFKRPPEDAFEIIKKQKRLPHKMTQPCIYAKV